MILKTKHKQCKKLLTMQTSQSIKNIGQALLLFHIKMDTIKFDSVNPFFKSKYASLTHILETIKEPLAECGLVLVQLPCEENGLTTILIHAESGEFISTTYYMKPEKYNPQAQGSVVTYQRRYCIQAILNLAFDEDDDGNAATEPKKEVQQDRPKETSNADLPWLNENTTAFKNCVEKMREGSITLDVVKQHYKLSKKVYSALMEQTKGGNQ